MQIISKQIFSLCHAHFNVYLENPECIPSEFTVKLKERKEAPERRFRPICSCKLPAILDYSLVFVGVYNLCCDLRKKIQDFFCAIFSYACMCASLPIAHLQCLFSEHTTVATFSGSERF